MTGRGSRALSFLRGELTAELKGILLAPLHWGLAPSYSGAWRLPQVRHPRALMVPLLTPFPWELLSQRAQMTERHATQTS